MNREEMISKLTEIRTDHLSDVDYVTPYGALEAKKKIAEVITELEKPDRLDILLARISQEIEENVKSEHGSVRYSAVRAMRFKGELEEYIGRLI